MINRLLMGLASLFICLLPFLVSGLVSGQALAGGLYEQFPETVSADDRYVFYSHGSVVEGENPTPVGPVWGRYDFPAIKQALKDPAYHLIAYHRPAKQRPYDFANRLANDVNRLIQHGVKAHNITLLGFSRGGALSILASHALAPVEINTIALAGCGELLRNNPKIRFHGHVLSIYETTSKAASCQYVMDRGSKVKSFKELPITTGKGNGAFYLPKNAWVDPVKAWILSERK